MMAVLVAVMIFCDNNGAGDDVDDNNAVDDSFLEFRKNWSEKWW